MSNKITKRRKTKTLLKRKNRRKTIKTRKNIKGGLLFDQKLNIGGIDFARETGKKRYNWETGKWDDYVCYGVGPLKGCKIVPAK
jgi:hypothetical protein